MRALILALALCACATSPMRDAIGVTADPVIAAELAFAQDVSVRGRLAGFRATVAQSAFSPNPDPAGPVLINAFEQLAQTGESVPGATGTDLRWRPSYAGIGLSGDLGFTTGPVFAGDVETARGNYFTVWRRQPDGTWRWIYDGGVAVNDTSSYVSGEPIRRLIIAERGAGDAQAAIAQVIAAEAQLAAQASVDASALLDHLADDAVVKRREQPQAVNREGFASLAVMPAPALSYDTPLRVEASTAGDLVFAFGPVHWNDGAGQRQSGFYARIWQLRAEGWRIVYDQATRAPVNPS